MNVIDMDDPELLQMVKEYLWYEGDDSWGLHIARYIVDKYKEAGLVDEN